MYGVDFLFSFSYFLFISSFILVWFPRSHTKLWICAAGRAFPFNKQPILLLSVLNVITFLWISYCLPYYLIEYFIVSPNNQITWVTEVWILYQQIIHSYSIDISIYCLPTPILSAWSYMISPLDSIFLLVCSSWMSVDDKS